MADIYFSPAERRGILVFLILCLLFYLSVDAYLSHLQANRAPSSLERKAFIALLKQQKLADSLQGKKDYSYRGRIDPNVATKKQLVQSGLKESTAERLIRFREKGAFYNSRSDLERVYGMDTNWLKSEGIDFVFNLRPEDKKEAFQLSAENLPLKLKFFDPNTIKGEELLEMHLPGSAVKGILSFREKFRAFEKSKDIYAVYNIDSFLAQQIVPFVKIEGQDELKKADSLKGPISLNQADTILLKKVKGIGSYLAKSIVEYRTKLGGFYSVSQLRELYSVDSTRFEMIRKKLYCDTDYQKLKINEASEEELYSHPYISYKLARNIVEFRERMRLFKKAEELMNIELVDGVLFSKLAPYLEIK
mgnify:CR=1 FL=1|tara:strand:+ start:2661 stop:3746 length:1086 start_codon:yes stop_codon:yes gene_type:complete